MDAWWVMHVESPSAAAGKCMTVLGNLWPCVHASRWHTCQDKQFPGKIQASLFHNMQMLSTLFLVPAVEGMGLRDGGGFKHRNAHWAHVWSTSLQSVLKRAPVQCRGQVLLMPAVQGARCSIEGKGGLPLVDGTPYHSPTTRPLRGLKLHV